MTTPPRSPVAPGGDSIGLTTRVFLATAAIVVAVVLVAILSMSFAARRAVDGTARRSLEQSADLVAQFLAGRERTLVGGARVFVQGPYFRTLVAERRRDDVLDQAVEAADQIDADWVFITDEAGLLIAKSDEPGVSAVAMGQVPLVAGALRGQVTSGFGASGDSMLFQAVAVPIIAQPGAPIGVLVATRVVDSQFVHDMSAATSSELLFYSRDERGATHPTTATLAMTDSLAMLLQRLSSSDPHTTAPETTANDGLASIGDAVRIGATPYLARGTSLSTSGGSLVGGFLVLRARESGSAAFGGVGAPLLVAMTAGLLIALLATLYAARVVTRPVRELAFAVSQAAEGNLAAPLTRSSSGGVRELRALAHSFQGLISDLRDREALLAAARPREPLPPGAELTPGGSEPVRASRTAGTRSVGRGAPVARQIARPGLILRPGVLLANRYVIELELGRGGLGIVYRALDRTLGETIAVKVLRPELVAADAGAFERLKAETRITRRLSHRNVVRTYDIGESADAPFLTMEYVDGASLATVIQSRGAMHSAVVLSIAKQLLRALVVAHEHGVIHGDIKPKNLLIDHTGLLKVTDFGVARLVRGTMPVSYTASDGEPGSSPGLPRLCGAVIGTPEYMAPEQLIGEPSSARTDLYAAGVVLHECATGVTPFGADTPMAFVGHKFDPPHDALPPLRPPSAPPDPGGTLEALVDRMRDPRAATRPHSARDLLDRLGMLG